MIGTALFISPVIIMTWVPEYKGPFEGQKEFQDRTVVVTGATGNIGTSIALQYARRKFRVIMACRDMERCKLLRRELVLVTRNNAIACRHLDLEDVDSINKFADDIIKNETHLNVLIHNAAIKELKERELTKYGIERMYFVNFLAPFILTFKLLDKLEKTAEYAGDARIINILGKPKRGSKVVTSDINFDKRKYTSKAAYQQSKLALAYFTILLERYMKDKGNNIYVYGASPCMKKVLPSAFHSVSVGEHLDGLRKSYYSATGLQASSTAAYCGIDHKIADRTRSGKLYSYFIAPWGWGVAGKDETKAKHVWNHAYRLVLNLTETPEKSVPVKAEPGEKHVQQSDNQSGQKE